MTYSLGFKKSGITLLMTLFALLLLAGVWAMTLYELRAAEAVGIESAERDARSFSRAVEEHTARTVESADQAVTFLAYRYNALGNALDIGKDLRSGVILGDIYNLFTIVDEHGDVALSSKPFTPTNLSDREHIKVHMQQDNGRLFISKPVLGRVSKKWSIQMTRRINYPDGGLKGVVVVSMDPMYFTSLYHDIDLGKFGSISLVGEDGTVRARHTGISDVQGQDLTRDVLFQTMKVQGNGTIRTVSTIDGRERIYGFRKLKQYPLYVTVGVDIEERLETYHAAREQALQLAALTSLIILSFAGSIVFLANNLIASREAAIAANKAKTRFLSNMSHELRTPLNGILGYSELLLEDAKDKEHWQYAQAIHDSGRHLLGMVDSILDLSALESGHTVMQYRPVQIDSLLQNVVGAYRQAAIDKNLALESEVTADVPADIVCDSQKVTHVLGHLLHNAIRFTDHGRVRINVSRQADVVLFEVSDSGVGIPAKLHQRIFDKFFQADESDTRSNEGAGIGLSISKHLVTLMGGHIFVQSNAGAGSKFGFTLPLNPGACATH